MVRSTYWSRKVVEVSARRNAKPSLFSQEGLAKLEQSASDWEQNVLKPWILKSPERRETFETLSGISLRHIYTPKDVQSFDYSEALGLSGSYPYTRGVYPNMYRGRFWTMRMFAGFGAPEDTNRRLKYLLEHGETGLSIAFDMPTLYGYDADHPRSYGEVGKCGVSISSLKDMETVLKDIPLDQVSTSMTINAPASILTCMYVAVGEKQNVPQEQLRGTVQADMLKEYIAQKEWVYPPEAHLRIVRDMMAYCTRHMPLWNYISISGYHIREAGANAVQELAFTLADGFSYIDLGIEAGLKIDDFAPRLSFFFDCDIDFFEEIAKFRAARRIWAKVLKEKYGAKDSRTMLLRFHTQNSGASLTWQQPMNNIVRTAIEALAAVLGGTQSLHTNSYDEAWALPSDKAVKLALRTQQIIADETCVADVVDPLGGSYYIEWLTDEMEEKALRYMERIENLGGVLAAVKAGYLQREISQSAYKRQRQVERQERIIVGVNRYVEEEQPPIETLKVDEAVQQKQIERVHGVKRERDAGKVLDALQELKRAYEDPDANCLYATLRAVRAYATLGEIVNVGREVFGEWREPPIL